MQVESVYQCIQKQLRTKLMQRENNSQNKSFKQKAGPLAIEIHFNQKSKCEIALEIANMSKCERYALIIDEDYLLSLGELFITAIKSVPAFYDYLLKIKDKLAFSEDGCMLIEIQMIIMSNACKKSYQIQAIKQTMNMSQYIMTQLQQFKQEVKEEFAKKDSEISQLTLINKQILSQIEISRDEKSQIVPEYEATLASFNFKLNNALLQIEKLKEDNDVFKISRKEDKGLVNQHLERLKKSTDYKLDTLANELKKVISNQWSLIQAKFLKCVTDLGKIKETSDIHQKEVKLIQGMMNSIIYDHQMWKRQNYCSELQMNPENPHRFNFSVVRQNKYLSIVKISGDGQWQSFINKWAILPEKRYQFKVKLMQSKNRKMALGISTEKEFGSFNVCSPSEDYIGFHLARGLINGKGQSNKENKQVNMGNTVTMKVNTLKWKVEWYIEKILATAIDIPERLKTAKLYLFITMCHSGDKVQLWL